MSDFWLEFAFFHGEALLVCRVFVFRSELHQYGLDECVQRQRELLFRRNRKKKVLLRHLEGRWTDEHKKREREGEGGKLNTSISELPFRRL